jgi:hypothetical protein
VNYCLFYINNSHISTCYYLRIHLCLHINIAFIKLDLINLMQKKRNYIILDQEHREIES